MNQIRVTYSGLISFMTGIVALSAQLGYLLILSRLLEQEELGTWGLIKNLVIYGIISHHIIGYWSTREIAREITSAKTAIFSSGIFSIGGVIIFIMISILTGQNSNADQNILMFAAILVPAMFFFHVLSAINLGWKPQAMAYGNLCLGIMQVSTSFVFLYIFEMGIQGVIIAIFISYLVSDILLLFLSRTKIKYGIQLKFLKRWLKFSWLPMYPQIGTILLRLDVIVFFIITGSAIGIAFWTVSDMMARVVNQSSNITKAIYPKLLQQKDNKKLIKGNLTLLFYFAIPIVSVMISLSRPSLFVLNPLYETVFLVCIFLSIRMFLHVLSIVFADVLTGIEQVDVNEKSTFLHHLKSKLFFMPTLSIIQFGVYIVTLILVLIYFSVGYSIKELVIIWSLILLITQIPHTIYSYYLVKQNIGSVFESRLIIKYILSSVLVFSVIYIVSENYLEFNKDLIIFLPNLLLLVAIGFLGYVGITYLIDIRTRQLIKATISEIKK